MFKQIGGGNCSLCGSPSTTKTTCPLNPKAKNGGNPAKHPLAVAGKTTKPAAVKKVTKPAAVKKVTKPAAVKPVAPVASSTKIKPKPKTKITSTVKPITVRERNELITNIKAGLTSVTSGGVHCASDLLEYLTHVKTLGSGSFGQVDSYCLPKGGCKYSFVIKQAAVPRNKLRSKTKNKSQEWQEFYHLKAMTEAMTSGRASNLPMLIDHFICDSCDITHRGAKASKNSGCIIYVLEQADGTLGNYLETDPSDGDLRNCLFQLMASLHSLQENFRLYHNDVKAVNILWFKVPAGGYFKYNVDGNVYNVPNNGNMFMFTDFGVSESFNLANMRSKLISGKFHGIKGMYEIDGDRVKLIEGGRKIIDGGVQYSSVLVYANKLEPAGYNVQRALIEDSDRSVPVEFFSDMRDLLKSFVGGTREAQPGDHDPRMNASVPLFGELTRLLEESAIEKDLAMSKSVIMGSTSTIFRGKHALAIERKVPVSMFLAKKFISSFFDEYTAEAEGDLIEEYHLS